MHRIVAVLLLAAGCRSSDGKAKSAPAGGTSAAGGAVSPAQTATSAQPAGAADDALLERADKARIQGDTAAKVWIVEVSDFQCPYCKEWHDRTLPVLAREFIRTGAVRMAYVNFPLGQHAQALPAAEAAMCAAAQDRFWQMHDTLFTTQARWGAMTDAMPLYDSLAVAIGVNPVEWRSCMSSHVMRRLISADRTRGLNAGVSSTPTFFVGSEMIRGAAPIDDFRAAIARARANAAAPPRTPN
jgi:protein-disulfide isomerase